jgi:hypothetical protein
VTAQTWKRCDLIFKNKRDVCYLPAVCPHSPQYLRMVKLLFFMASVAHWVACFWHLIYKVCAS